MVPTFRKSRRVGQPLPWRGKGGPARPETSQWQDHARLLRELASSGEVKGDTTALEDFGVIARLTESEEV